MLRRLTDALKRVTSRSLVGRDSAGNTYYLYTDPRDGPHPEKREVKYARNDIDPRSIPVEWQSWLAFRRAEPPSAEESVRLATQRAEIKQRALEWDEEDRKMRLREQAAKRLAEEQAQAAASAVGGNVGSNDANVTSVSDAVKGHGAMAGGGTQQFRAEQTAFKPKSK
jgi:NADH:ubiquinone oxidoreductase subunit